MRNLVSPTVKRPGGRSGENLGHFSSLVGVVVIARKLTYGNSVVIPGITKTKNMRRNRKDSWLTTQSEANRSHPVTPCFPLLCSEKQAIFPFCGTTSGQHFFKFCRLFRWLWCFSFDARAAIIPPQNRDIFFNVSGTRDLITGENSKRVRKRQLRSSPLLSLTLRSATAQGAPGHPRACVHIMAPQALRAQAPVGKRQKPRIS
jgi:hypothetical protein